MTVLLLDTCAVIYVGDNEDMASAAVDALDRVHDRQGDLFVSPVTAWELGVLVSRGRYRFPIEAHEWFNEFVDRSAAQLASLSTKDLIASSFLPGKPPSDPADRIIIATARQHGYHIMTRDRKILDYAEEGHVNAIAC